MILIGGQALAEVPQQPTSQQPELQQQPVPQPASQPPAVTVAPTTPRDQPVPPGAVRIEPEDHARSYAITLEHGGGTVACGQDVSWLRPCTATGLPAGPMRVTVRGGANFTQDLRVPEGGATYRLWHRPYDLLYAGVVGTLMGTTLLLTPSIFLDGSTPSAPFYVSGALLELVGLTFIAVDVFEQHDGLRPVEPGRASNGDATSPHLSGIGLGPTRDGAQLQVQGRF